MSKTFTHTDALHTHYVEIADAVNYQEYDRARQHVADIAAYLLNMGTTFEACAPDTPEDPQRLAEAANQWIIDSHRNDGLRLDMEFLWLCQLLKAWGGVERLEDIAWDASMAT